MKFAGFPEEGVGWFQALALEQTKPWFEAHRADYERLWVEPMKGLLAALSGPLAKLYPGRKLGPARVMRIHRDVRFSKDKTPYKTSIHAVVPLSSGSPGSSSGAAALYLQLGLEQRVGFGFYALETPQLLRLRQRVLNERTGRPLEKLVAAAERAGLELGAQQALKRPPSGVPADHPRLRLLKNKGLALTRRDIPRSVRYGPELEDWLLAQARAAAPVVRWGLAQRLG